MLQTTLATLTVWIIMAITFFRKNAASIGFARLAAILDL